MLSEPLEVYVTEHYLGLMGANNLCVTALPQEVLKLHEEENPKDSEPKAVDIWNINKISQKSCDPFKQQSSLPPAQPFSIALQDDVIITTSEKGTVKIWDLLTGVVPTNFCFNFCIISHKYVEYAALVSLPYDNNSRCVVGRQQVVLYLIMYSRRFYRYSRVRWLLRF